MTDFGRKAAPADHGSLHEYGGADVISVASLSGELADSQPPKAHDLTGGRHNAGILATFNTLISDATLDDSAAARTPVAHKTSHQSGGTDPLDIAALAGTLDHGGLAGKDDDDHTLYHTNARGDARYPLHYNRYSNVCHAWAFKSIIAGSWGLNIQEPQCFNYVNRNSSGTINDEIEFEIFAEAGSKTFEILTMTYTNCAIMTVYLDGVDQGTIDNYSGSLVWNVLKTLAVTVVGTKLHELKLKAESKNGSSSEYVMYITSLRIY